MGEGPVFDNSLVTNVTAQFGGTAHLQCKILNIRDQDNPVSLQLFRHLQPALERFPAKWIFIKKSGRLFGNRVWLLCQKLLLA